MVVSTAPELGESAEPPVRRSLRRRTKMTVNCKLSKSPKSKKSKKVSETVTENVATEMDVITSVDHSKITTVTTVTDNIYLPNIDFET